MHAESPLPLAAAGEPDPAAGLVTRHPMLDIVHRTIARSRRWAERPAVPGGPRAAARSRAGDRWPANDGELARLVRDKDWGAGPLRRAPSWPDWLKSSVTALLDAPAPSMLLIGPQRVQIYNDAFKALLGPHHPGALGQPLAAGWPELGALLEPAMRSVVASGHGIHCPDQELPVSAEPGAPRRRFSVSYAPLRDHEGTVRGLSVAALETTGLVRMADADDAALRRARLESQELHSLFQQACGYMAIVHGEHHVFQFASPACQRLFANRATAGARLRDVLPAGCDSGLVDILDQAFRSGQPYVDRELRITLRTRPDAAPEVRYLDVECQPILVADGRVCGLFVQGHDVTRRTVSNRALQDVVEQKEEFLAMLAHELRNPLAPIINVGSILRHLPGEGDRLSRLGDVLNRQARHMRRLIDDLLDASRVRKRLLKLNLAQVDVRDAIHAAVEQVSSPMKLRGHELTLHVPDQPLPVLGDGARLVQVIANLLHNAAKYTPPGGRVALRAGYGESGVEIAVSDNGIGLDAAFLPQVFEPFSQADRPPGAENGLGLGLALVRSLAELHGGSVEASSEGLGCGSTFTLRLPPWQPGHHGPRPD